VYVDNTDIFTVMKEAVGAEPVGRRTSGLRRQVEPLKAREAGLGEPVAAQPSG